MPVKIQMEDTVNSVFLYSMMKTFLYGLFTLLGCSCTTLLTAQKDTVYFTLSLQDPASHKVHVTMQCKIKKQDSVHFKMPHWTPGYYQIMNYANQLSNFSVSGNNGLALTWQKTSINTWAVYVKKQQNITVEYDVLADSPFVATSFMDTTHAYLTPAATFLYIDKQLHKPVSLIIQQYKSWNRLATGLDSVAPSTFTAPGFDMLFDCPILAGNLEELPSFTVNGIPHRFIGYKIDQFDKAAFMNDIKSIVEASVDVLKDIPYKHYTFLGIGPGNGGIEHLTSSANSFTGKELNSENGRKGTLSFLAHEYFHNYNVKRVRPIELGPFDYDNGSKTTQLWVSEGWTVYYEYLVLKRAGLISATDVYKSIQGNILAYEKHNGKNVQSLSQSSYETWNDGPFGNDPNKTISYYDKGPVVALMLDFSIRHHTNNKRSLDDVIRKLYNEFYKKRNRGFTDAELRKVCEAIAGNSLEEIFSYVYTTQSLNYSKYFNYGGLTIDSNFAIQPIQNPDVLQAAILKSWSGE